LVNNAGIFFSVKWDKLGEDDWDKMLGTNLKGAFFCAQAAARVMQRQGHGRIVIISSLGGLQAWPDYIHYCASKAGVISLTRSLAKALAPRIQVNSVAPGTILFPGERRDARMERIISRTPLRPAALKTLRTWSFFSPPAAILLLGKCLWWTGGSRSPELRASGLTLLDFRLAGFETRN
jgi:NAD(P)-dependent dehydrogenase (short-subunit alcohol dehydrogenase family)